MPSSDVLRCMSFYLPLFGKREQDASKMVRHMRYCTNMDKGEPNMADIALNCKKEVGATAASNTSLHPILPFRDTCLFPRFLITVELSSERSAGAIFAV